MKPLWEAKKLQQRFFKSYFKNKTLWARAHTRTAANSVFRGLLFPESLHERHFISVPDPIAEDIHKWKKKGRWWMDNKRYQHC